MSQLRKIRILHLEDVKADVDLIDHVLHKANIAFEKCVIDTKREFLVALDAFQPELIISDHSMPSFNSLEAMDILAERKLEIPFILVTGTVSEEFAIIAMKKGASDYILKDRLQRLPASIHNALASSDMARQKRLIDHQLYNISRYSKDIICTITDKGHFSFMSDAARTMLGYAPEEMVGRVYSEFLHPDDIAPALAVGRYLQSGGYVSDYQNRYIHKEGRIIPLTWSYHWEEAEKTVFCIGRDASEQIRARMIVEEGRRQYEQLVKNLPAAVYTCDKFGNILLYNDAAIRLWGRKPDPHKDKWVAWHKLYHSDGSERSADQSPMANALMAGRPIHGEEIIIEQPDGSRRNVMAYPTPQFDDNGELTGGINLLVDVTESHKIEEENRKLALIVSKTHNSVIITDADRRITWVNKGFEKLTGYALAEVKGKKPGRVLQGKQTDPATVKFMRESLHKGERFQAEILNYTKDGSTYWINTEVMPLSDSKGNLNGFMAVQQDITERKRMQQRTSQLVERLQAANKNIQSFSHNLAHSLRSPIARLLGLSNLYRLCPDERDQITQRIECEAHKTDQVLHDINLLISYSDPLSPTKQRVRFSEIMKEVMTNVDKDIQASGARLTADFSEVPEVTAIRSYVADIIYRLISNAIRFRALGKELQISVRTFVNQGDICLSVSDNGLGIDLERDGCKLFELYNRFHPAHCEGTGMGLCLVKAQAEALGGNVKVTSAVNQGSTFTVILQRNEI